MTKNQENQENYKYVNNHSQLSIGKELKKKAFSSVTILSQF